jgi:hypothetical protein
MTNFGIPGRNWGTLNLFAIVLMSVRCCTGFGAVALKQPSSLLIKQ